MISPTISFREINLNDELFINLTYAIDTNPNELIYSASIIYESATVDTIIFEYD